MLHPPGVVLGVGRGLVLHAHDRLVPRELLRAIRAHPPRPRSARADDGDHEDQRRDERHPRAPGACRATASTPRTPGEAVVDLSVALSVDLRVDGQVGARRRLLRRGIPPLTAAVV
ncbi:hypothetical protein CSO01_25700 [Cellulomonas soli]|uniref:Uncharacterized protein n=1 Tax=Cellulomonas soli TaxID=931535 RepID=A0A512PF71_9CELL|nr:hypothetical protein CSO01_25700 [Cellulomonas soli]